MILEKLSAVVFFILIPVAGGLFLQWLVRLLGRLFRLSYPKKNN